MRKIRTLLIGLGRIASLLEKDPYRVHPCTHSGALFSRFGKSNFLLSGIYDRDPDRVTRFLNDWQLDSRKILVDIDEIKKADFDLCVIASSSLSHYENAVFAIQNKIGNLLIEKPACLNLVELKKIHSLAEREKVNVWVNHERRYHPVYSTIRKLLFEKKIGEIKTIKASVLTNSVNEPTNDFIGHLLHDGTHAVDYIHWLLGKPKKIESKFWARDRKSKYSDRIVSVFEYSNGEVVFLEVGGGRKYFQFEIDIETTTNRIVLSNDGHRFYSNGKSTLYKGFYSLQPMKNPIQKNSNPWINLYMEIRDLHSAKSDKITGSLKDNLEIMEILEKIRKTGKRM